MKAADFDYFAPPDLPEALRILASGPGETRVMAGGQSLLPLLKARLSSPTAVVDLGRIPGLDRIGLVNGSLKLGAMVRQSRVLESELVATHAPLLARAIRKIGSPAIRNRGTVGGSAAHADPAAEIPAALVALDAVLLATGPAGTREIPARQFFRYAYETDLAPDEILTGIHVPLPKNGHANGAAFYEVAIPDHNFALAGAAVRVTLQSGCLQDVRIALCALGPAPLRAREAETLAEGCLPSSDVVERVARAAATIVEPVDDVLASAKYRRSLAPVVVKRAMLEAVADARSREAGMR